MMFAFVLIAGSLAAGAAVLLLLPLVRRREDSQPAAAITAGVVLFGLLLGGGALYAAFSNYSWVEAPAVVDTPAAAAARLAKELAKNPDNIEGWMDLGRRYFELQQYPLAMRAFQRADRLAGGKNTEAISSVAEIMLAQDFENIRGAAGRMFERVLELEPQNAKALMYSALAAMGRGENALARDRFQRMLALNPRADIRHIVEKQISAIDAAEAGQGAPSPATVAGGGPVQAQGQAQTQGQAQIQGQALAQVQVHVTVSPSLRYQLTDQSALFVAARDPNQPGPPFAAKRLPLRFPVDVTLSAADAMLPQRQITAGQTLDIVARISISGQPQSTSGDPYGQVGYHVGKDGKLNLVIDKLAP
jgi:cytochrome c-type biogenesis protein CcmH